MVGVSAQWSRRCAGDPRRTGRRRRRTTFHAARRRRLRGRRSRRADGRAVAAPVEDGERSRSRRSAASMPAASSSCWTATTTGSAPSSFRRAASTRCTRAGWRRSAPRSRGSRRTCATGCMNSRSWDDVKLLTVAVNRLDTWFRPGLLFIGDAAHAMSPVGGVGINLAIQDAVAAANILVPRLRQGAATLDDLRAVQRRREWPTRMTQRMQIAIQNRVISNVLRSTGNAEAALGGADARALSRAAAAAGAHHRHGVPAGAHPALNAACMSIASAADPPRAAPCPPSVRPSPAAPPPRAWSARSCP